MTPASAATAGGDGAWRRLHPLSPVVRLGEAAAGLVVVAIGTQVDGHGPWALAVCTAVLVLGLVVSVANWRATRWQLADATIRVDRGVLHRQSLRLPISQVQAVDLVQPVVARLFGLAEVRLRAAATTGTAGRLAYLRLDEADALRRELLVLVRRTTADRGAAESAGADRVLAQLSPRPLLASLLLDAGLLLLVLWVTGAILAFWLWSLAAGLVVVGVGLGGAAEQVKRLWRNLNAGFGLVVTEAAGGLRVRCGFLSHASETIPSGRVQAARIVQPLLWRPFGWWTLQLQLAGAGLTEGRGSPGERQTLRALLPVGSRAEVGRLLGVVFDGAPAAEAGVPRRARWRAPRAWRWLAWGSSDAYVVASTGRLQRSVTWVPLAKVQGVRLVRGPLQRRLRLASVHVETAGRAVHAVLRDRDEAEAGDLTGLLPTLCTAARGRVAAHRR